MKISSLSTYPSDWVNALGLTLFHSIWVGLILALLTSAVIIFTRQNTASVRYNLLTTLLCLFVGTMGYIFYGALELETIEQTKIGSVLLDIVTAKTIEPDQMASINPVLTGVDNLMSLWFSYSNQIVFLWFFVICIKGIKLFANLNTIQHLKTTQIFEAGKYWENKVYELSKKLEIAEKVRILQSGLAKVPMVAGHFKPIILVPLGLLNGLSMLEVEAILCHELAHVKRRDYLVNFFQSLIETIFFFNPAVLWLSNLIKEERENCCDDLALSCTQNKKEYIKALIACEEYKNNNPELAMSITGRKNQLLGRVSRMIYNKSTSLNLMEKVVLTGLLIFSVIFFGAFSKPLSAKPAKEIQSNKYIVTDFTVVSAQDTTKKGKKSSVKKSQVKKKQQYIEHPVTAEDLKAAKEDALAAREDAHVAREDAKAAIEDAKIAREDARVAKEEAKLAKEKNRSKASSRTYITNSSDVAGPPAPPAPIEAVRIPAPPAEPIPSTSDRITKNLLTDGIVSQIANLSFTLNSNEMIVNGRKQSDSVHKKYRSKYIKNGKQTISVSVSSN